MLFRELDDGSRVYPIRGDPPPDIPGYSRDPGNQYRLIPFMPECSFRKQGIFVPDCCPDKAIVFYRCDKGFKVTGLECQNCIKTGRRDS
jgi:hypothetical protein